MKIITTALFARRQRVIHAPSTAAAAPPAQAVIPPEAAIIEVEEEEEEEASPEASPVQEAQGDVQDEDPELEEYLDAPVEHEEEHHPLPPKDFFEGLEPITMMLKMSQLLGQIIASFIPLPAHSVHPPSIREVGESLRDVPPPLHPTSTLPRPPPPPAFPSPTQPPP